MDGLATLITATVAAIFLCFGIYIGRVSVPGKVRAEMPPVNHREIRQIVRAEIVSGRLDGPLSIALDRHQKRTA